MTSDWKGDQFVLTGELSLWGSNGRGEVCTGNAFFGCDRTGNGANIVNPVMSARLRTLNNFAFR